METDNQNAQTPESLPVANFTSPTPDTRPANNLSFTLITWSVVTVIMLAIGWGVIEQMKHRHASYSDTSFKGVIAIDSGRIFNQRLKNFMAHDAATSDKQATMNAARDFGQKFHEVVDEYRRSGYLVINSRAILAGPDGMDKTSEVAGKMGLTLDAQDAN